MMQRSDIWTNFIRKIFTIFLSEILIFFYLKIFSYEKIKYFKAVYHTKLSVLLIYNVLAFKQKKKNEENRIKIDRVDTF